MTCLYACHSWPGSDSGATRYAAHQFSNHPPFLYLRLNSFVAQFLSLRNVDRFFSYDPEVTDVAIRTSTFPGST